MYCGVAIGRWLEGRGVRGEGGRERGEQRIRGDVVLLYFCVLLPKSAFKRTYLVFIIGGKEISFMYFQFEKKKKRTANYRANLLRTRYKK